MCYVGEGTGHPHPCLRSHLCGTTQREAQLQEIFQVPSHEASRRQDEVLQCRGTHIKVGIENGKCLIPWNLQSDEVFLEAQVQNVTNGVLSLEKVLLEPSQLFGVTSLNAVQEEDEAGHEVTR